MPDTSIHLCPRCELRFVSVHELGDHLEREHDLVFERRDDRTTPPALTAPRNGTILVPVDPQQAPTAALAVAAAFARRAGMGVTLVAVPPPGLPSLVTDRYLAARAVNAFVAGAPTVAVQILPPGDVAEVIVDHARTSGATFLCMATHARRPVGEMVLGSVSEAVLRRSPVPVLLVGPHVEAVALLARMVVAIDGSRTAEGALDVARRLAGHLGAALNLMQVVADQAPEGNDVLDTGYLRATAEALAPPPHSYDVLHGRDVAAAIVDYATGHHAAVIALGTDGWGRARQLVLGSVALDVARLAHCPVLVVPATPEPGDTAPARISSTARA
jgi:nucleotide-binding universal stress UspA family protein